MNTLTRTSLIVGALLMRVTAAVAQRPENVRPAVIVDAVVRLPGGVARSPLAVIDRLLSFDANKDQRVTRDELPERMQALIARGDTNGDGALNADEIRALVNAASAQRNRIAVRFQPSEGLAGVVNDLKLPPAKRDQALAILNAQSIAADATGPPSLDVSKAMKQLLDEEDYENFAAAAARLSRTTQIAKGCGINGCIAPPPPPPRR